MRGEVRVVGFLGQDWAMGHSRGVECVLRLLSWTRSTLVTPRCSRCYLSRRESAGRSTRQSDTRGARAGGSGGCRREPSVPCGHFLSVCSPRCAAALKIGSTPAWARALPLLSGQLLRAAYPHLAATALS